MQNQSVIVGMSGGADSSYVAALLKSEGYRVIGVMLNLWTEPSQSGDNRCCSIDSQYIARRVASQLDIPFYVIDAKEEFRNQIVEMFIADYLHGKTPNPCVACNVNIRWKILLDIADKFGVEIISTGHYARIEKTGHNHALLFKGADQSKDQSYVLSMLGVEALGRTILPLGTLTKAEVREKSREISLPSHNRADSQDLCFMGGMDYKQFLRKYAKTEIFPGDIIDEDGNIIGKHEGLPFYTIGQRKGLRIANSKPLYVIAKDPLTNRLVVGEKNSKNQIEFLFESINWIQKPVEKEEQLYSIMVRYRSKSVPAKIEMIGPDKAKAIITNVDIPDVVPGQIAVVYSGELCMGGGIIV